MRRFLRCEKGSEMTEAALTLPVMLLILMAVINLGYMAYEAQVAQAAARHGARMASVAQGAGNQVAIAQSEAAAVASSTLGRRFAGVEASGSGPGGTVKVTVRASVPQWLAGFNLLFPSQVKGTAFFRAEGW